MWCTATMCQNEEQNIVFHVLINLPVHKKLLRDTKGMGQYELQEHVL